MVIQISYFLILCFAYLLITTSVASTNTFKSLMALAASGENDWITQYFIKLLSRQPTSSFINDKMGTSHGLNSWAIADLL